MPEKRKLDEKEGEILKWRTPPSEKAGFTYKGSAREGYKRLKHPPKTKTEGRGWHHEPKEHGLAARGIKTKQETKTKLPETVTTEKAAKELAKALNPEIEQRVPHEPIYDHNIHGPDPWRYPPNITELKKQYLNELVALKNQTFREYKNLEISDEELERRTFIIDSAFENIKTTPYHDEQLSSVMSHVKKALALKKPTDSLPLYWDVGKEEKGIKYNF